MNEENTEPEPVKKGPSKVARARTRRKSEKTVKIPKMIQSLLDSLTSEDIQAVGRVYREAMNATHRYWRDDGKNPKTGRAMGKWIIEADHKTRLAAANMVAAYREGLPVQKQIQLSANVDDFQTMVSKYAQLERERSLQKTVQGKEIPPTLPEPASDKGGGAN